MVERIEGRPTPVPIKDPREREDNKGQTPENMRELQEIMQYQFAVYDIALYLDTHPNDMAACEARKKYAKHLQELIAEYEEKHGPMSLLSDNGDYRKYINGPWPWEICF